jgi:hypothetical protein
MVGLAPIVSFKTTGLGVPPSDPGTASAGARKERPAITKRLTPNPTA